MLHTHKNFFPMNISKIVAVIQAELTATWNLILLDSGQWMFSPLTQA